MLGRWIRNAIANLSCTAMSGLSNLGFLMHIIPVLISSYYGYRIVDQPMRRGLLGGFLGGGFWSKRTG